LAELATFAACFLSMTAKEARARARECEERAKSTDELTVKSINEYLAAQWRSLADQLEREGRV
jgi:hypothetical protein